MSESKNIFVVAGDSSGDVYGARLVYALDALEPGICVAGLGGDHMAATGMTFLYPLVKEFSVVGLLPIVLGMPKVMRFLEITLDYVDRHRPDAVVLIDYPGFNLYLATHLKKRGIPVVYYVTPQIWAWGTWRTRKIQRFIDKMLVIFPFEADFYRRAGVEAEYVGHPLLDRMALFEPDSEFRNRLGLSGRTLGILPGSRRIEIAMNLPLMLWIAGQMTRRADVSEICIAMASEKYLPLVEGILASCGGLPKIHVVVGKTYDAILNSRLVLCASGTVTLEAAMLGAPMSILYRVKWYHKWLARHTSLLKCKFIGLPNIVAGRGIVPEHLVCEREPVYLLDEIFALWEDGPRRERCLADLGELKQKLEHPGASRKAAAAILKLLAEK